MLDRRQPDYWSDVRDRKAALDEHFRRGAIGESTYLLSLQIWRYTAVEQKQELAFRRMEIEDGLAARRSAGVVRFPGRFVDSRRRGGDVQAEVTA
jgi:hypothetical protein